ncbi:uncharacterized protein A4U43_C04F23820 [Asparagus officinalis]|uniref:Uncharacterized protein n=1 Tax=Asparagus officinalis TaxID=4686 RepID=A0A5P1F3U8_ASPOF|nr:uncharacterized protein A4U43_C04F23820 [Asparagus officinalis]
MPERHPLVHHKSEAAGSDFQCIIDHSRIGELTDKVNKALCSSSPPGSVALFICSLLAIAAGEWTGLQHSVLTSCRSNEEPVTPSDRRKRVPLLPKGFEQTVNFFLCENNNYLLESMMYIGDHRQKQGEILSVSDVNRRKKHFYWQGISRLVRHHTFLQPECKITGQQSHWMNWLQRMP